MLSRARQQAVLNRAGLLERQLKRHLHLARIVSLASHKAEAWRIEGIGRPSPAHPVEEVERLYPKHQPYLLFKRYVLRQAHALVEAPGAPKLGIVPRGIAQFGVQNSLWHLVESGLIEPVVLERIEASARGLPTPVVVRRDERPIPAASRHSET